MIQAGNRIWAYEIKWRPRRIAGAAFRAAYGVTVQIRTAEDPWDAARLPDGVREVS